MWDHLTRGAMARCTAKGSGALRHGDQCNDFVFRGFETIALEGYISIYVVLPTKFPTLAGATKRIRLFIR